MSSLHHQLQHSFLAELQTQAEQQVAQAELQAERLVVRSHLAYLIICQTT